ncbi:DUF3300 domain-containing protein [Buttiauxella sp. WJP83]|uniref:DUF3300 domain-containing protein n=1 Tax=Buttiauxella sp. WJP83 TaxID=2986951 RepID=UPI0022DD18D6|nr:DUF3300 domain-containing protein [Buttiauxella sp. WJP83]WBM69996.1 DUF3300 domain-containing protein [Buttiauxella sp. WJP83]
MKLPFKPHILALVGSAVILAASGVLLVKSQTEAASSVPEPVAQPAAPAPAAAPATPVAGTTAPLTNAPTFTSAQIDQWVAPVALFPDPLLSQVLMAATYPANVVQAVQWSHDNPKLEGDAAVQAVSTQPWDPSVKSLVAFPQLTALMGENPQWVQNLGDAFLAQPKDVMDSVQKLRLLAEQTGALKTTPQQTVTTAPVTVNQNTTVKESSGTSAAPAPTVIKIEPTDPQVVYVPTYNPSTVYGTWPNTAYPPVYLPPPEDQFGDNFVDGLGFGLGIVTTAALFGSIDWDDDDYHHHDNYNGGGGYNRNGDNNINIDVDRYNRVSGQHLANSNNMRFQHNPAYRDGVGYQSNAVSERYNRTNAAAGLSTTPNAASANRDAQRQAARTQVQQTQRKTGGSAQQATSRDAQRKASAQQVNKVAQRNNYRGYDTPNTDARRNAAKTQANRSTNQQNQRRQEAARTQTREQQNRASTNVAQRQQRAPQQSRSALSGNDSRSPSWQAQNQRGQQSLNRSSANREHRGGGGRERGSQGREFNRR